MKLARVLSRATLVLAAASSLQITAGAQMPDARQMSGIPLPVADLPAGTITVRVVRGAMTNVIAGQIVELTGGPAPLSAKTNDAGRAEFTGLAAGTRVRAVTSLDGQRLESQEFAVPAAGGIRLALVADDSAAAAAPAQPGVVVLGERSRFVIEMGDEALNVFALFDIVNSAQVPVQPPQPVVFDLPDEGLGAGMLEGSAPQAVIAGKQVRVNGPFLPGSTLVQFGYSLPIDGNTATVDQRLPVDLNQVSVMAQKVGNMELRSAQIAEHRDMPLQGETFIVGKGPGVAAGQTVSFTFTGLPHRALWPRNVALILAVAILLAGVWASARPGKPAAAHDERRRRLDAKRDRLFGELTALEDQYRKQSIDPERYASRRGELIAALERIYSEMDGEAAA
jgi:hypothetical protein